MNKQLEFVDKNMYYGKRLVLELCDIKDDLYIVEISDFTVKDGAIQHDWDPPRIIALMDGSKVEHKGSGNPKYKEYSKNDFEKIFKYK